MQRPATGGAGELVAAALGRDERGDTLHRRVVRAGEIGRAAPQFGHDIRQRLQGLPGRRARAHLPGLEDGQGGVQPFGRLAAQTAVEEFGLLGALGAPHLEALVPLAAGLDRTPLGVLARVGDDRVVEGEGLGREAEALLEACDLRAAQLAAVHAVVARLRGQGPADDRGHPDERRPVGDGLGRLDGLVQLLDVLGVRREAVREVDVLGVPPVGGVAGFDVFGEGDLRVALDRDPVVVVDQDEVAQVERGGQRGRLRRHPLLHAPVAGDAVHEAVEDGGAGGGVRVEELPVPAGTHREADSIRHARAERAGRALDAVGVAELGVAGGPALPLAQVLQVLQFQAVARQVELGVLQHRGVPGGQDEPVAADPARVGRVGAHHLLVEHVRDGRQRDRRARVAVASLLDGVRGQDAGEVDR